MESQDLINYQQMYSLVSSMCNYAPDLIWAKDLECRYLFANQAICDRLLHAKDTEEPIGKTDLFFALRERASRPDEPEWHTFGEICCNSDRVVIESGQPGQFEEFGNIRGKFVCLDVRKAPFFDASGCLIGTVGCARDITLERETQQALRDSEEKFRNYMQHAPYGVFVADLAGRYLEVNPSASRITGYAEAELLTMSITDCLLPESLDEGISHFDNLVQTGSSYGEMQFRTREGEIRWWSVAARKIAENRFVGFCEDVTDRKQAEEVLRESESTYSALVRNSTDGIVLRDASGLITYVNDTFVRMMQANGSAELLGRSYLEFVHPEDREESIRRIALNLAGTASSLFEHRLVSIQGRTIFVESTGVPITKRGTPYVMGVFHDISQRKTAEEAVHSLQAKMAQDIEMARRVQMELLPKLPPSPHVDVRYLYYPSNIVSGDSYLLEWRNEGKMLRGFLIDVTGHGLATALQAASINVLLRDGAATKLPLLGQLRWINARASKYFTDGAYVAMLAFELDLSLRELRYVGAGITQFFVNGKKIIVPGMFVGMWEDGEFISGTLTVSEGDCFYFLTDGFTDALAMPKNAGCWSPEGQNIDADVAALERLAESGELCDDASGICLKIR